MAGYEGGEERTTSTALPSHVEDAAGRVTADDIVMATASGDHVGGMSADIEGAEYRALEHRVAMLERSAARSDAFIDMFGDKAPPR